MVPLYRQTPAHVPIQMLPALSTSISETRSLQRPSLLVKLVNDVPSYLERPECVANHKFPSLSSAKPTTVLPGNPSFVEKW